jgi:hypothetical protein
VLLAVAAAALATGASAAAPSAPLKGVVVEGATFAGLPLGLTPAQVQTRWGKRYGVCDDCRTTTWYYTFKPYHAQGIGVRFRNGRVEAYFTLGAPNGWRTRRGVTIGNQDDHVSKTYGSVPTVHCFGYDVMEVLVRQTLVLFYLNGTQVYGLGLMAHSGDPCR